MVICSEITFSAIIGASDPKTLIVGTKDLNTGVVSVYDFSDATKITASLHQEGVEVDTADSSLDAGVFDYDNGNGELVMDFGLLSGIAAGEYDVRILKHTASVPGGIVLNRGDTYTFDLVVTA